MLCHSPGARPRGRNSAPVESTNFVPDTLIPIQGPAGVLPPSVPPSFPPSAPELPPVELPVALDDPPELLPLDESPDPLPLDESPDPLPPEELELLALEPPSEPMKSRPLKVVPHANAPIPTNAAMD